MREKIFQGLLLSASLVPGGAMVEAAEAAEAAETAETSETTDTRTHTGTMHMALDEIVVTARRREERMQAVPLAVSALGSEQLERENINDVQDLNGAVPNLQIIPSSTTSRVSPIFSIRGLSQEEFTGLADPSVSLYINDVVVPRAYGSGAGLYDVESVQILRGPQGTLFGRNTTGGAVVVTTKKPDSDFGAAIEQTFGNLDTLATEAYVNVPMGSAVALRVAARHDENGGYVTDVVNGNKMNDENHTAARLSLNIKPTDNFDSLFVADYSNIDDGAQGTYARPGSLGGTAQQSRGYYETASGVPVFNKGDIYNLTNNTSIQVTDGITLRNIVGYRDMKYSMLIDSDGSNLFLLPIGRDIKQHQISEEFQVLGEQRWGNWIVGGYYFHEHDDDQGMSSGTFAGCGTIAEDFSITDLRNYSCFSNTWSVARNTSKAIFAQTTFNLGLEGLTATLGARGNWDTRKAEIRNRTATTCRFTLDTDGDPATAEVNPGLTNCFLPLSEDFSEPTYNVSLEYRANNDLLFYLAHRHGYRTGGFGARASTQAGLERFFKPETVDDVELGAKTDWYFGDTFLRANLALFYSDYKDIQRLLTDVSTAPVTTVTSNAGKAKIKGLELEFLFRPIEWLELSGYYSYTDAKFSEFIDFAGNDLSSNPIARAPKHLGGATTRVIFPIGRVSDQASLGLRYMHSSGYSLNDDFRPGVSEQEGYNLLNLSASATHLFGSGADLFIYADNLTDKEYSFGALGFGATSVNTRSAAPPRTYGARLRYSF